MAEKKEKKYVSDNAQLMAEWDWEKNSTFGHLPIYTIREVKTMIDSPLYDIFRDGLDKMLCRIPCATASVEHINHVLHLVLLNNPQFCHFEGDWTWENGIVPIYILNSTQRQQLAVCAAQILEMIQFPAEATLLEKAKTIFYWLANNISYDRDAPHHQSAYGALVERKAVCKGIAKAYQLLLQILGIPCELVEGTLDGSTKHLWVRFFVDGKCFHSDVTMVYPQFRHIMDSENSYAVSEEHICRTHTIWNELQQSKSFFQSLEKQLKHPPHNFPDIPPSMRRFLPGDGVFQAAGSVSKVYRFGDHVLKLIPCGEDPANLYYAMRECAMLQRLQNCWHIAALHAWDVVRNQDGYTVYLALQWEKTLDDHCQKHPPSPLEAVALIRSACDALQECYLFGVAHLDIQPGNLLVTKSGATIKLTDFSSSATVEELSQLDAVRGTPAYMAPEVYHEKLYSQCADVYSLGIILYCMLHHGKLPFGDQYSAHEAVTMRMEGRPIKVTADMPNALRHCIEKACSYDSKDRYQTLTSFANALKEISGIQPSIPSHPQLQFSIPGMPPPPPSCILPVSVFTADTIGESTVLTPPSYKQPAPVFTADTVGKTTMLTPPSYKQPAPVFTADTIGESTVLPPPSYKQPAPVFTADTVGESTVLPPPSYKQPAPVFTADTIGKSTVLPPPPPASYPAESIYTIAPLKPAEAPKGARIEKVQFSAIAPQKALKGEYTLIQLYMYEEGFRHVVEEVLQTSEIPLQEKRSGIHQIQNNTNVKVILTSRDIEILDNVLEETWTGDYLCFDFSLDIPQNLAKQQILLVATVFFNNIPATRLMMTLRLQTQREQRLEMLRSDVLSAFVSYASQDRVRVAGLIQGMKKARPDMDIFFDVDSLRSGENWEQTLLDEVEKRDILFLCWSKNAKKSPWVEKEWRWALATKGLDSIEPIPLEPPDGCPPPAELQNKHFNDSILYIMNK